MDRWKVILKYVGLCVGVALLIVFFAWAERGVNRHQAQKTGKVYFDSIPEWVSDELRMELVGLVGGAEFELQEGVARQLGRDLERSPWLEQVRVQTQADRLLVSAQWRKPLARIVGRGGDYYVDADGVALKVLALPSLPIVAFKNVAPISGVPWGSVVPCDDVQAGLALIKALADMDRVMAQKARQAGKEVQLSLLWELQTLDLANYNGRVDENKPHLIFQSKDGTAVVWGAELGAWGRHLEVQDDQKLARLYTYYHHDRPLQTGPPPAILRLYLPQGQMPQPIYRY